MNIKAVLTIETFINMFRGGVSNVKLYDYKVAYTKEITNLRGTLDEDCDYEAVLAVTNITRYIGLIL